MTESLRERWHLVGRLRQIVRVLARHGFYEVLKRLSLHRRLSPLERLRYARLHRKEDVSAAVHLRQACEELGPTFVEFGQLLSGRPDLIPSAFARELGRLLAHAKPLPWQVIHRALVEELGKPEELFSGIDHHPLAAASIAQIHRATLKDGAEVVIKVQRPGIDKVVEADLAVLRLLAHLAEKYLPEARPLNPKALVEEFALSIAQELDFALEAANTERFARAFAGDPQIHAPKVHRQLSTPRVLVLEYLEGILIDDVEALRAAGADLEGISQHLLHALLLQIFRLGFFHADPHPGNFLVLPGGGLAFIDFGLVGQLNEAERQSLIELFQATLVEDYERVASLWLDIAHAGAEVDRRAFERGLQPILRTHMNQPFERIQVGEMFLQMVHNGTRHGLKLPRELFLLFRTFAEIEGVLRKLHPGLNAVAACLKFAEEQQAAARQPGALLQAAGEELQQLAGTARRLPREVEALVKKAASDQLSIDFVHKGLEFLIGEMDRSSNRIAVGLIIAALIIGSSLVIQAGRGPSLWGLPLLGLAGFTVAFALALVLIWRVLRSGKF
jgi:ubiquinone biosynthesis protein